VPYFTRQVAPHGGLVLTAVIGVSQPRQSALAAANQPVPSAARVEALVDTGASHSCVDPSVLSQLNLSPTGQTRINTPSTGGQPALVDQYDVSLLILTAPNQQPLYRPAMPVVASELVVQQGFHVLLGRDVLRHCLLVYDGLTGLFSLAY
jgi:hypothetical protein